MLKKIIYRSIKEIAQALFAPGQEYPDYQSTQLVNRVYRWSCHMPTFERVQLLALFIAIYLSSRLRYLRLQVQPTQTKKFLEGMIESRLTLIRFIGNSLKGVFSMHYMSSFKAMDYFKIFKHIEYPFDRQPVPLSHLKLAKAKYKPRVKAAV